MFVEITLDRPRHLRFDLSAFRALEDAMGGKSTLAILNLLSDVSITAICAALYAGLKHEDPKLTVRGAETLFNTYIEKGGNTTELMQTLSDAIGDSMLFKSVVGNGSEGNAKPEPATTAE